MDLPKKTKYRLEVILIGFLNFLNFLVSVSAIGTLVWFHGYKYYPEYLQAHLDYLNICFVFYIVQFLIRGGLSSSIQWFFKENWFEYYLYIFLSIELLMTWTMDFSLIHLSVILMDVENFNHFYVLLLHVFLILIVGIELGQATIRSTVWRLSPPILFVLSYVILVVIGSSLMMLPEVTASGEGMDFVDALFTSISANCVTGLAVVDTATYFSFKGKFLLMILIQIGGLNIIAFATYFIVCFQKKNTTFQTAASIKEMLNVEKLEDVKRLVWLVVVTSLSIELVGAIIIYNQWGANMFFASNEEKVFFSFFHAVSAFNNAGFTLLTDGFTNEHVQQSYGLHFVIAWLIILGGIGFSTLEELYKRVKQWRTLSWTSFTLQSRIAIASSAILIMVGMTLFMVLEHSTLEGQSTFGAFVTAFFQSVTTRTAGFNTVDFGSLSIGMLGFFMLLMIIGASSGSTGGGIKTSTFMTLLVSAINRFRLTPLKEHPLLHRSLLKKALTILYYSLTVIGVGFIILFFVESNLSPTDLLFEQISAFGTVGLSTGITSKLSVIGKTVIMITMFVGRIGSLALAYALIPQISIYEEEPAELMIG